jgi:TRAP-type mannitol/chloroaromatic compound transport system substrate-binding protein
MTTHITLLNVLPRATRILAILCFVFVTGCLEKTEKTYDWHLQSQATNTSSDFKEMLVMADEIRVMSNGRLNIKPVPGGTISGGPDIFNAVKNGTVEMGNGWPNWWSGQHPAWAVMNAGPFDFMNLDASMLFFLAGDGTKLANELSIPEGVIWRPAWWPGMEFGLLSTSPINGIDDLAQKKIRVGPGLPSEVLSAAGGAYTVPLVPQEIRPALESGELDAVEWTTTSGAWDLGLQDIAKHAIVPAIWQPSVLADFLINEKAYSELPPDLQMILETAIRSFTLRATVKNKVNDFEALAKFQEAGTTITRWSAEDIERWRVAADKIYADYSARDVFTARLIKAKQDFKKKNDTYYEWFGSYE